MILTSLQYLSAGLAPEFSQERSEMLSLAFALPYSFSGLVWRSILISPSSGKADANRRATLSTALVSLT